MILLISPCMGTNALELLIIPDNFKKLDFLEIMDKVKTERIHCKRVKDEIGFLNEFLDKESKIASISRIFLEDNNRINVLWYQSLLNTSIPIESYQAERRDLKTILMKACFESSV